MHSWFLAPVLSKVLLFSQGQQNRRGQHWYSCSPFLWSHQWAPHPSNVSHYSVLGSRWNVGALAPVELHWCRTYHSSRHEVREGGGGVLLRDTPSTPLKEMKLGRWGFWTLRYWHTLVSLGIFNFILFKWQLIMWHYTQYLPVFPSVQSQVQLTPGTIGWCLSEVKTLDSTDYHHLSWLVVTLIIINYDNSYRS